jgi:hypothetical protein
LSVLFLLYFIENLLIFLVRSDIIKIGLYGR